MHRQLKALQLPAEPVAWVLDDVWPETASMMAASAAPGDQLVAPGIFGGRPRRYEWPIRGRRPAAVATVRRHWAMRRVARASGALRQQAYLDHGRMLAHALARSIDYRARHLVVAQAWLPWLHELGVFGGRTFDVVMSRYPFGEIHRLLDKAAAEMSPSTTAADFRAPDELVECEAQLLTRARRIYTPHAGVAALFPRQSMKLAWHKPVVRARTSGKRVAFLGPTIARQRPDIVRRLVSGLGEPLVVFGPMLEQMWDGLPIERRVKGPDWLDGIGAIVHPAIMTHEPRALLEARAAGVALYATETCGLDPSDYLPLDKFSK